MVNKSDFYLIDNGTIDTVIRYKDLEITYSCEFASYWRDETGTLNFERFIEDNLDDLEEYVWQLLEDD